MKNVKLPYAREKMKIWLEEMEGAHENLFKMINASFKHIHDDTFMDPARWRRDDLDVEGRAD